jgi:hypothetical protein
MLLSSVQPSVEGASILAAVVLPALLSSAPALLSSPALLSLFSAAVVVEPVSELLLEHAASEDTAIADTKVTAAAFFNFVLIISFPPLK